MWCVSHIFLLEEKRLGYLSISVQIWTGKQEKILIIEFVVLEKDCFQKFFLCFFPVSQSNFVQACTFGERRGVREGK